MTRAVTVRTQPGLNAAIAAKTHTIYIDSHPQIMLFLPDCESIAISVGASHVYVYGSINAYDDTTVYACDDTTIYAYDRSRIYANTKVHVKAFNAAQIWRFNPTTWTYHLDGTPTRGEKLA